MLEKLFKLQENKTDIRTEIVAGSTTFMTMAYIIFVQPAVLSAAGMDAGAVFVATCLASAVATILFGFLTNYPIAQAPAMGHNFYFAFAAIPLITLQLGEEFGQSSWQIALGAVLISGTVFLILSLTPFMKQIIKAVPDTLKHAIAVGIGLLIAFLGLQWGGVVVDDPGSLVSLGTMKSAPVILTIFGTFLIAILTSRNVKGAILIGILANMVLGLFLGIVNFQGVVSKPPSLAPTMFKLDILGAFNIGFFTIVFTFFILDLFDTIGTLIGVSQKAGFIREDGTLPRANKALQADAVGTITGAILGTSTVTSYIESAAGVSAGGRTGLANMVTGLFFLVALFFSPLVSMIGSPYAYQMVLSDGRMLELELYPVIAPALITVGCLMTGSVARIKWSDFSEAFPAFLTIVVMPFSGFSITEGIAFGFISYVIIKFLAGRGREVHWLIVLFALLFLLRYIFM
ncbi:MAG: NCS2 family permease [Calditrichaeota bacterium]|nr:MAG: NCS2 family permease [Calditrichota bacterium]